MTNKPRFPVGYYRLVYEKTAPKFLGTSHERMKLVMEKLQCVQDVTHEDFHRTKEMKALRDALFDLELEVMNTPATDRCKRGGKL